MSSRSTIQLADPVPNVKYRIQNVDLLTYLELYDNTVTSTGNVYLRPAKQIDRQYWRFEKVSGTNNYSVRNVANTDQCLMISSATLIAGPASTTTVVNVAQKNDAYRLAIFYSSANYYFYTSENVSHVSLTTTWKEHDAYRWRLIPVTSHPIHNDFLHPGNYRIRNINGKSLLTMPEGLAIGSTNVYVRSQLDQTLYQRWIVNLDPSIGHYTIQNAGNNLYLGGNASIAAAGDNLVGLQKVFPWDIQSVGGFAWSLRIPETEMSIGVVDNCIDDEDEICLVPSDTTTSQVWFMEKYFPICPDKIHAKREVEEGNYFLQSTFNSTVYMEAVSSPWHITAGSEPTTQFKLKYVKERSARFTLTLVTKSVPAPVIADVGGYIGLALKATEFILLEKDEGSPGHVICRADSGHRHKIGHLHKEGHIHKVVSSRVVTDINDNAAFAIDSREAGELEQMWILVPA